MSIKAIHELSRRWHNALLEDRQAITALKELRGIEKKESLCELELGLVEVPSPAELPDNIAKGLASFGIMDEKLNGMVSVPLRQEDSRITNFLMLSLNGATDKILRKGGLINLKAFSAFRQINITDNFDDFLTYFQRVKENIIPLIQSDRMIDDFARAVKRNSVPEIILLGDSPRWEYLKPKLEGTGVKVYEIALPGGKSVKQALAEMSANKLLAYMETEKAKFTAGAAAPAGKETLQGVGPASAEAVNAMDAEAPAKEELPAGPAPDDSEEDAPRLVKKEGPGEMRFFASTPLGTGAGDRAYRVRGFNRDGFEKIVQISLEMDGRAFPDKADISRSQSRGRFANIAAAEFEASAEMIREDLAFIYQTLDEIQTRRYNEKAGINEKEVHIITPQEETRAVNLLTKRDLLNEILIKDTERLGYVGEEVNKKLFYISAASRLTGKPVSVLDISPSGTGKSFGLSAIMDLMPTEEMMRYTRLTPAALYYKSEDEIKGKALYIEELVGMEESLEQIRMILSSGELAVLVTEKDPRTGQYRTVTRRIKADIPILSSGVRDIFDEETLSRFILTYNDVTRKHLEDILKAQSFKYSLEGGRINLQSQRILKRHRDIQKVMDRTLEVRIPFADRIMINPGLHIAPRKQEQYLRIIYNIAFLRQHSRERKKERDRYGNEYTYIEARREDVATANEIITYVFQYLKGDLTKRLHDAYQAIQNYCAEEVKEKRIELYEFKFSRREIREYTGWNAATAKRLFDELESLEYIKRVRGDKQGMQYLYRPVRFNERKGNDSGLNLLDPDTI